MLLEELQYNRQVVHILTLTLRIYIDIINEYNYKRIKVISEHSIHKDHES